jgi:hypothetical protein
MQTLEQRTLTLESHQNAKHINAISARSLTFYPLKSAMTRYPKLGTVGSIIGREDDLRSHASELAGRARRCSASNVEKELRSGSRAI